MISVLALIALISFVSADLRWTGRADVDFLQDDFDDTTGRARNFGVFYVSDTIPPENVYDPTVDVQVLPDVGVPIQLRDAQGTLPISGWDIKRVFFQYNDVEDALNIGIDCFGICGDADGDGDPGAASPTLTQLGGQDLPNLARAEGFALIIDFDLNVADVLPSFVPDINVPFDFVIGIPAGQPAGASANADPNDPNQVSVLECTRGQAQNDLLNMVNCFGVYEYQETTEVNIASRFLRRATLNGQPWPIINHFPNLSPTEPDLEWTIGAVTDLRALKGASFQQSRKEPWTLLMQGFAGSFVDDGIGEDFLPSQTNYVEVNFPCLEFDVCDVCLGPGITCLDCAGIPNGPNVYDECDVCGGNSDTCLDCNNVPNGPAMYDVCDVCDGNSDTCLDCRNIPNGPNMYDECDVCDGNSDTCLDCADIPNGPNVYDVCDVCGGVGDSCLDCLSIPNGPNVYDICDECAGPGTNCLDCEGTPFGPCEYDMCDVCCGDDSSCVGCDGIPNSGLEYDACGVCGGDGKACRDCRGEPFGSCEYDQCDVCCGDGKSCVGCDDIPNSGTMYDDCGICGGDGTSCEPPICTDSTSSEDESEPRTMRALLEQLHTLHLREKNLADRIHWFEKHCDLIGKDDDDSSSDDDDSSSSSSDDDDSSSSSDDDDSSSSSSSSDDDDSDSIAKRQNPDLNLDDDEISDQRQCRSDLEELKDAYMAVLDAIEAQKVLIKEREMNPCKITSKKIWIDIDDDDSSSDDDDSSSSSDDDDSSSSSSSDDDDSSSSSSSDDDDDSSSSHSDDDDDSSSSSSDDDDDDDDDSSS